jgi:hypothetical protein
MRSEARRRFALLGALVLALGASGTAWASTTAVSAHVHRPTPDGSVHISFRAAGRLPPGGYYYAVIALRPYRHYTRGSPPCSTSSNVERADYGYRGRAER